MKKSRYKKLTNCTIDELADMVDDLENISIHCLKEKKLSMRRLVLTQIPAGIGENSQTSFGVKSLASQPPQDGCYNTSARKLCVVRCTTVSG